jgi:hypothetical protein
MRTITCVRYQLLLSALTPEWFRHNLLTPPPPTTTTGPSNSTQNLLVLPMCYRRTEPHIADFARDTPYKRQQTRTQMHPACSPLASDFSRPVAQTRVVAPSRAEVSVSTAVSILRTWCNQRQAIRWCDKRRCQTDPTISTAMWWPARKRK